MKRLLAIALLPLVLAGCAEASPHQTVNIPPGPARSGYTAQQLAQARNWLRQPHPELPKGWRYAVILIVNTKFDDYLDDYPDCGTWAAMAAYADGTLGLLCESMTSQGQAAMLLSPGDAVTFDDRDHDQTFTLPKELRLQAKDVAGAGQ